MIYDFSEISNITVYGDIHGEFKTFFNTIIHDCIIEDEHPLVKAEREEQDRRLNIGELPSLAVDGPQPYTPLRKLRIKEIVESNNQLCIVAGDCGFGFNKPNFYLDMFKRANEKMAEKNIHVIFVRGNHDDPSYFNDEMINFSHIKAVSDYSVLKTATHNILCIGGAISVDRTWRKQQEAIINKYKTRKKKLYWENEGIVLNGDAIKDIIEQGIEINAIISHSAPSFVYPDQKDIALNWFRVDPSLKEDMLSERKTLSEVYNIVNNYGCKIDFWAYGHFHEQVSECKKKNNHYTMFIALDDRYHGNNPILTRECHIADIEAREARKKRKKSVIEDMLYDWTTIASPFSTVGFTHDTNIDINSANSIQVNAENVTQEDAINDAQEIDTEIRLDDMFGHGELQAINTTDYGGDIF